MTRRRKLYCYQCGEYASQITDAKDGSDRFAWMVRRRFCWSCGSAWATVEMPERALNPPAVELEAEPEPEPALLTSAAHGRLAWWEVKTWK